MSDGVVAGRMDNFPDGKLRKVKVANEHVVLAKAWRQFDINTGRVVSSPSMNDEDAFEVQIRGPNVLLKRKEDYKLC